MLCEGSIPRAAHQFGMQVFLRVLGFAACALLVVPGASSAQQAPISVAPIAFTQRTLANGLRVVIAEDHRTPTVAIDVGYDVGGKSDPAGRSGFAHLFEHLMFKGTANVKPESMDRFTEDVGGYNNAYTAQDITNYYEIVPSNHLERLLWAEADRMVNLTVDQPNFVTERKVVIGEYDQRILSSPYGMLFELVNRAYTTHPYRFGVIGNPDELNAASLANVIAFHSTFYRPDNATLVLVGDLDPAQANAWVDKYFGPLKKPSAAIPRVTAVEPVQTKQRRIAYTSKSAPLPATLIAYHIPAERSADTPALNVLETLLGSGPSSRLRVALVDTGIASQAAANADTRQQAGLFDVFAIANAGKSTGDLEAALAQQIARVRDEPVPAAELEKAKTQAIATLVRSLQTHDNVAQALVRAAVLDGDPGLVNRAAPEYARVTAADVERVARKYLTVANSTVVAYQTAAQSTGAAK
ncbi:MAG: zinc protease [Candidatus Eremiobacteraeota bacterium]|nr:zinc protease [Candidatus Eremiobacteraeota bacterium]